MRFKICGITTSDDALVALEHGAHALGFLVGLEYPCDGEVTIAKLLESQEAFRRFFQRCSSRIGWMRNGLSGPRALFGARQCNWTASFHSRISPEIRAALPHMKITRVTHAAAIRNLIAYERNLVLLIAGSIGATKNDGHARVANASRRPLPSPEWQRGGAWCTARAEAAQSELETLRVSPRKRSR